MNAQLKPAAATPAQTHPAALLEQLGRINFVQLRPPREAPPGCWTDREGRYVPIEDIEDYEQLREQYLAPLAQQHLALYLALGDLKQQMLEGIEALIALCWEKHGVQIGGKKLNATLYTYDGLFKFERSYQNRSKYDERIGAAEALIQELLDDMKGALPDDARKLISAAFERNTKGELRRAELVRLRGLKLDDARYAQAMDIIADAEQIIDRACYITVSVRDASGKYVALPLDFAAVRPHRFTD